MGPLKREERQTLRYIQNISWRRVWDGAVVERLGTVDVTFHPTNPTRI